MVGHSTAIALPLGLSVPVAAVAGSNRSHAPGAASVDVITAGAGPTWCTDQIDNRARDPFAPAISPDGAAPIQRAFTGADVGHTHAFQPDRAAQRSLATLPDARREGTVRAARTCGDGPSPLVGDFQSDQRVAFKNVGGGAFAAASLAASARALDHHGRCARRIGWRRS